MRLAITVSATSSRSQGRLPGLRSCGRFRAGAGPQVIDILAGPWPVVVAEHPADGIDHELGVADVQVELAEVAAVAVGNGDGRLDRARRDAFGLQAQAVEREGGCCLLARRVGRHADDPGVVPAAADRCHGRPLRNCSLTVYLTVAQPRPGVTPAVAWPPRRRRRPRA